jgi:glucose/arabinose dehydrogenase
MRSHIFARLALAGAAVCCFGASAADVPLNLVKLPEGFKIEIFAEGVEGARSLAVSPNGTVFAGQRQGEHVYAMQDKDGDGKAETVHKIVTGMSGNNGVAFKDGALYVGEISKIIRFDDIENHLDAPPQPAVVIDSLPTDAHHGWKYISFGPDNLLYFGIGAPCNICNKEQEDPRYATICRIHPDGSNFEIVAHGVRNTVGFTWHPTNQQLWFSENGRDLLGDDRPPCEINKVTELGQHFGYPYCHGGNDPDPEFAGDRNCDEFVKPMQNLAAHVAPLGVRFYTGDKFPGEYRNALFIAEHGSWNRSIPQGYRITYVKVDDEGNVTQDWKVFAEGWLRRTQAWGRPVDLQIMPDGAMLVSDDKAGVVYRISYQP